MRCPRLDELPPPPEGKYNGINQSGKRVVVIECEIVFVPINNESKRHNAQNIHELDYEQAKRNEPESIFVGSRIGRHEYDEQRHEYHSIAWSAHRHACCAVNGNVVAVKSIIENA